MGPAGARPPPPCQRPGPRLPGVPRRGRCWRKRGAGGFRLCASGERRRARQAAPDETRWPGCPAGSSRCRRPRPPRLPPGPLRPPAAGERLLGAPGCAPRPPFPSLPIPSPPFPSPSSPPHPGPAPSRRSAALPGREGPARGCCSPPGSGSAGALPAGLGAGSGVGRARWGRTGAERGPLPARGPRGWVGAGLGAPGPAPQAVVGLGALRPGSVGGCRWVTACCDRVGEWSGEMGSAPVLRRMNECQKWLAGLGGSPGWAGQAAGRPETP